MSEKTGLIGGICAACGLPGHRYGTTDPQHKYSATACINGLLFELQVLSTVAVQFATDSHGEAHAVRVVGEAIAQEKERIYASHR